MKDTTREFEQGQRLEELEARYQWAVADLKRRDRAKEQVSYAVALTATAAAGGFHEKSKEPRAVLFARNFCVLFAFTAPIALLVRVALGS